MTIRESIVQDSGPLSCKGSNPNKFQQCTTNSTQCPAYNLIVNCIQIDQITIITYHEL